MKTLVVVVIGVVAVVLLLAFARYETIAPCGMLRAEAKRHVLRDVTREAPSDGLEAFGVALGASVTDFVLEGYTASLTPLECLNALVRLHKDGDVSGMLESGE